MRVTEGTNYDTIRGSIRRSRERMEGLQAQSASMKKLNTPSDDPVGASKVLEIRTDKVNNEQFQMNGRLAESFLNNTDHALGELSEIIMRAKEIAVGQSSAASSNDDTRLGVAEEVSQLFQQAVAVANRRIGERYLFGGYQISAPPVDLEGGYQGDNGQIMTEIARGVFISMNVPGVEVFNTQPKSSADGRRMETLQGSRGPASAENSGESEQNINLFDEIQNLRIALLAGDLEGIRGTLERFDQMQSKLIASRAKIGSRVQGIQSTTQTVERHNVTNAQLSSTLEDADMAQVMSDLAREETVFRSALASAQKLIQPTLIDFLK